MKHLAIAKWHHECGHAELVLFDENFDIACDIPWISDYPCLNDWEFNFDDHTKEHIRAHAEDSYSSEQLIEKVTNAVFDHFANNGKSLRGEEFIRWFANIVCPELEISKCYIL